MGHVPPGGVKGAKKKGTTIIIKIKKREGKKREKGKEKKEEKNTNKYGDGKGKGALLCPGQTRCKHGAPTSLGVKYNV